MASEHSREQTVHHSPLCLDKYREADRESHQEKNMHQNIPHCLPFTFGQCGTKTSKTPAKQNRKYSSKIQMIIAVILLCHSKLSSRFLSTVCHKWKQMQQQNVSGLRSATLPLFFVPLEPCITMWILELVPAPRMFPVTIWTLYTIPTGYSYMSGYQSLCQWVTSVHSTHTPLRGWTGSRSSRSQHW